MYGPIYAERDRLVAARRNNLISEEAFTSQFFQLASEERAIERQETQMHAGQMNRALGEFQNIQY